MDRRGRRIPEPLGGRHGPPGSRVLAQWLPVLFWLLLCSEVVNLVDQRVNLSGIWDGISLVVSTVLVIGMLVVFWKLAPLSRRFRTVWRIELALQIVSVGLLVFLFLMEDSLDTASALPGVAVAGLLLVAVGLVAAGWQPGVSSMAP